MVDTRQKWWEGFIVRGDKSLQRSHRDFGSEEVGGPAGLVYGPIQLDPAARRPLYMSRPSSIRQPDCKRMRHEQPCMFDPDLLTQGRNYAQRLSEPESLAPRHGFEPRFTAPDSAENTQCSKGAAKHQSVESSNAEWLRPRG